MNALPSSGPMIDAIPNIAPPNPYISGRLWSGTRRMMMMIEPERMFEGPAPAIARPTMRTVDLDAAPQRVEPIFKRTTKARKTYFGL